MGLIATDKGGGDFIPLAEGIHVGVCDMVIDLGVQPGGLYGPKHKCYIRFNVPAERRKWSDEKGDHEGPATTANFFPVSMHAESNLRKFIESWFGKGMGVAAASFDLFKLLGRAAQIQVVHKARAKGGVNTSVKTIMALPKGLPPPVSETRLIGYSTTEQSMVGGVVTPATEVLAMLPEGLRRMIGQQIIDRPVETTATQAATPAGSEFAEDDMPF